MYAKARARLAVRGMRDQCGRHAVFSVGGGRWEKAGSSDT
jgi:hypothetical protein